MVVGSLSHSTNVVESDCSQLEPVMHFRPRLTPQRHATSRDRVARCCNTSRVDQKRAHE